MATAAVGIDYATLTFEIESGWDANHAYYNEWYAWQREMEQMELRLKYASDRNALIQPKSIRYNLHPRSNKEASRRLVQNPEEL